MHQKNNAEALPETLQHFVLSLAILFIVIGAIGVFCLVKSCSSIHEKRCQKSFYQSAIRVKNEAYYVNKLKTNVKISSTENRCDLEKEVKDLRAFQQEVKRELCTLKTALVLLADHSHSQEQELEARETKPLKSL